MNHEDFLEEHIELSLRLERGFSSQLGRRLFYRAARRLAAKMGVSLEALLDDLNERDAAVSELNDESN